MTDYRKLIEEDNPYLDLVRSEQTQALQGSISNAAQSTPDIETELRKLAETARVPVETVRADRKEIERQAAIGSVDYNKLIKDSPVTSSFLTAQAEVARDDIPALERIERTFTAGAQGWKQGSIQDQVEPYNWKALTGVITQNEQTERQRLLGEMNALSETVERGDNPFAWFLGQTGYTGRQLVTSVREGGKGAIVGGAGLATAAAVAGTVIAPVLPEEAVTVPGAFFFGARAGYITATTVYNYKAEAGFAFAEYENMRDVNGEPLDPAVARGAAAAAGLLNAGLETVGDIALARLIPGLDKLVGAGSREAIKTLLERPTFRNAIAQAGKKWLQSATIEGVTESLQELGVILGRELAQGVSGQEFAPDRFDADVQRIIESGVAGFAGGAGVGIPGAAVAATTNVREVRKANQTQQFMEALGEAAGESKLRDRLPQIFQDFVAKAREQGPVENVYVPVDQFTQYWQSQNVDAAQVADEVGATNYAEAVATGTDVVIPIENYATRLAPTQHHSGLIKDVRLFQGDLTMREVEALESRRKEIETEIQNLMETEGLPAEAPAIEQIKQDVLGQLMGRFDRQTADNYATLYSRAINSLAQRAGLDPTQLHEQYGLQVVIPLPDVLQAKAGVDTVLDPLIDRLRSGDIPTQREIFGKSLIEFLRERGGVQDQGGELSARDAELWDRENRRPGERRLVSKTGMTLDEAREIALGLGYEVGETEVSFLDAIDREIRGEGVFRPSEQKSALSDLADALTELEEYLGRQGIDVQTTDNATIKELIKKASEGMGDVPAMQFEQKKPKEADSNVQLPDVSEKTTAINIRKGPALTGKQRMDIRQVGAYFDRITGKRDWNNPSEQQRAIAQLVEEIRYQMDQAKSGLDWYDEDIQSAFSITQQIIPALQSETKRQLFSVMAAILSPATLANLNWQITAEAFEHYEKTGTIPGANPKSGKLWAGGTRSANKKRQLDMLNAMVNDIGEQKAVEWLFSEHTVKELNEARSKWGGFGKGGVDGKADELKIGLFAFGPKVGPFVANINGIYELTIDMWATRTFNRYFGQMLDESGKIVDAPSEPQRRVIKEIFNAAAEQVGIKPYQAQSVIWFFEQQLFNHLGTGTQSTGFSDGARRFAGERGVSEAGVVTEGAPGTFFQAVAPDEKRGYIQFGADRRVKIGLLEKADLSTFIHETGHFYLEVLLDLAERPDASPQIKADAETLMKWFKVKSRSEIGVKQHEEFARANEAYLMEGNAPSSALRGIFQRVRAWMTLVYNTLTNLNVRMNDDVRGVFDRIYATDAEIEAANAELDAKVAFATAADAGMTEVEFAAYKKTVEAANGRAKEKLQNQLMREYQREREKWWKQKRKEMMAEVTAEVDESPPYRAAAILIAGEMPNGVPIKLSKQKLVQRFGEEYLRRLPSNLRKIYTKDGGTDIETAAQILGFESGSELMSALVNLRPRKNLIEAETDARMAQQYGDMRMDGTIADEAMNAVHNSERSKVLEAELLAIRRLQRQARPVMAAARAAEAQAARAGMDMVTAAIADPAAFRRIASGRIGQMQARDIQPNQYLLAERRASKAAFDAIRKKDYQEAAIQKQRELLNHYLYLEARKAQAELDKIYNYANKFDKKSTRERLAKAGGGYLDQIDAILEKYEFKRVPIKTLTRRQSLIDFADQQAQLGLLVNVPDELLDEARLVNYKNATVDELRAVYDTVRNIEHIARLKDKLLRKAAAIEFENVKNELISAANASDRLKSVGELGIPNTVGQPLLARGAKAWRKFDAALIKVEQMIEWLDGGKIEGPWARYVFDLANDAQTKEYELHAMVTQKLQQLTDGLPKDWKDTLTDRTDVVLPGFDGPVTRYTLISIALNVGNNSNYQRLIDGYGWSDATINSALQALTKSDWNYIQGIWDTVNSLWPEIKALEERTSGVAPPKVEPRVVQTAFGDYEGGYFPLAYDPRLSAVGDKQADAAESVGQFMSNAYGRARTDRGYTKQRVENLKAAVSLDYEQVLTSHLSKVIKDISHREAIFSLNKLLKDSEIKEIMIDKLGEDRYREFNKWMQVLVSDRADSLHSGNVFSRGIMQFRTNMAIVTMGWKITTMMAQFAGIGPSLDLVKPRFFTQALIDYNKRGPFSTHRETLEQFVYERSGEMKFRTNTIDRDVRDNLRKLRGDTSPLATIRKSAFYLTAMADRQVTIPTWLGAYRQALAEGLAEEDAIRAGDRAVRLSQGAGGTKDLAAVQRDNELMKLLTMYYTPFSVLYARMRDVAATTRRVKDMPRAVARMLALVVMPAVIGEILAGRGPEEDEDETWWTIRKTLLYPLASLPIIKEGAGAIEASMITLTGEGEMKYQPSWRLSPVAGAIEQLGRTFMKTADVAAGNREFNDVAWDLLDASGYIFGLPTRQIRISGEYTLDVLNDEANPESPQQAMYELLYGRPKE